MIRERILQYLEAAPASDLAKVKLELASTTEALEKTTETLDETNETFEKAKTEKDAEISRLEGLLDVAPSVDSELPGNEAQRFFRSVASGGTRPEELRDFTDPERTRILRTAHKAYALQGNGENVIDTHLDFMLGDSLRPKAKDENDALQVKLDEIWQDPRNRLKTEHEELTRSLLLEGELFQRAVLSADDGHLETHWIDPISVSKVHKDRRGRDAFLEVTSKTPGVPFVYFVLDGMTDQITIDVLDDGRYEIREETIAADGVAAASRTVDGLVFAWFWSRTKGGLRGQGELTSVLDQIDAYDEMIWSTVDVQNIKRLLLMHIKSPTIKLPAEGREFLKQLGLSTPPRNPRTFATNDRVEIDIIRPPVAESERWLATELGTSIMGAKGFPESWRGSQGNQNLAGARAADFLPLRRLRRKQRKLTDFWHRRIEVELELQKRAQQTIPEGDFEIITMEVGGKDQQRQAEVFKAVSTAVVQALSSGALRPELGNAVLIQSIKDLGIEVPKGTEGVPDELGGSADKLEKMLNQLVTQKNRTDDGSGDEGDRDRGEEGNG